MKKQLLTLFVLPALMLTSCSAGKELTKEEAEQRADEINEKSEETPKNVEIKLISKGSSGKGDDKKVQNLEYVVKFNEDGEFFCSMKGTSDDEKIDITVYKVISEEYEEVTYAKTYNESNKKYDEVAITKKGNILYDTLSEGYTVYEAVPLLFYAGYAIVDLDEYILVEDDDGTATTKFYSTGAGNLTIEQKYKYTGEISEDDEEMLETTTKLAYSNYLLESYSVTGKSNYGNTATIKLTASYPSSKVKISLPSGWEKAIEE